MLIKMEILERIKSGDVTLAFRRWRRPTVKSGGTLRTAIGELSIKRMSKTTARDISDDDARRAGNECKAALLAELGSRTGDFYRIEFAYAGEDGRVALRENDKLSDIDLADIVNGYRGWMPAQEVVRGLGRYSRSSRATRSSCLPIWPRCSESRGSG